MNDQDFKNLFKSMKYAEPTELEQARWKKIVRRELLERTPSEWARIAVACLIGFVLGAAIFKTPENSIQVENSNVDATIERVYINL